MPMLLRLRRALRAELRQQRDLRLSMPDSPGLVRIKNAGQRLQCRPRLLLSAFRLHLHGLLCFLSLLCSFRRAFR